MVEKAGKSTGHDAGERRDTDVISQKQAAAGARAHAHA